MFLNTPIDFTEIFKLHDMLINAGIPHTLFSTNGWLNSDGWQIRAYYDNGLMDEIDDCVIHGFSHGVELGLLESCKLSDCAGWETAEEIFNGWKAWYDERKNFLEKA